MAFRNEIRFILNNKIICLSDVSPSLNLLDFLRIEQGLSGTKEGCNEGDCGACTVLVGRLKNGELVYENINACLRFVASLDLCHIVSIEHLKSKDGTLHPIQQKMIDYHASQCGFCTPGIIMSLYGLFMSQEKVKKSDIIKALQGNLCRCTGYEPIIKAALEIAKNKDFKKDILNKKQKEILQKLKKLDDKKTVQIFNEGGNIFIPKSLNDFAIQLEKKPKSKIIAGATDISLWIKDNFCPKLDYIFIGNLSDLKQIKETKKSLSLGANITYFEAKEIMLKHFPFLSDFWFRIGGAQIRNMGTIGGNIANGSPIADMAPPLIALGAELVLQKGKTKRKVALEDFYISYGKQDLKQGEFVKTINIPLVLGEEKLATYKISKRKDEDISTLCGAFNFTIKNNKIIKVKIVYSGLAAKVTRAKKAEEILLNQTFNEKIIKKAANSLEQTFTPINDLRASADYRMLVAKNLLKKFYFEHSEGK